MSQNICPFLLSVYFAVNLIRKRQRVSRAMETHIKVGNRQEFRSHGELDQRSRWVLARMESFRIQNSCSAWYEECVERGNPTRWARQLNSPRPSLWVKTVSACFNCSEAALLQLLCVRPSYYPKQTCTSIYTKASDIFVSRLAIRGVDGKAVQNGQ